MKEVAKLQTKDRTELFQTSILSPYRPINHSLQKLEAIQSVHHVIFILCYIVL